MQIRPLQAKDLLVIKEIIELNQMFPAAMLDAMTAPYLGKTNTDTVINNDMGSDTEEFWCVTIDAQRQPVAVAYCAPEYMTEGTWNLLLIAVLPEQQGLGIGSALMCHVEHLVKNKQGRLLLVETSGLPDFRQTREFYPKCGYHQVAVIPEFYDRGDDKVIFSKYL